jgi:hypothetical protein
MVDLLKMDEHNGSESLPHRLPDQWSRPAVAPYPINNGNNCPPNP